MENKTECIENITFVIKTKTKTFIFELSAHIENDSDSVILLLGSAQIPSTAQWEITPIVQCWHSYRAVQIKETSLIISAFFRSQCKIYKHFFVSSLFDIS